MSDAQQGPDWWQASDAKWYPPEQAPPVPPASEWSPTAPPPGPPPSPGSSGNKVPLIVAGVVGVVLLLVVALVLLSGGDDDDASTPTTAEDTETTEGDGSDTTVDGSGDLPDGYALLEGDEVSIGAPEGWELVAAEDLARGGEDFSSAFPDAPEGLLEQGLGLFENGAVLVAFDFSDEQFADNVNVVEIPGEAPLEEIEGPATQQLSSLGGEVLDSGIVDAGPGEALRIEYTIAVALPDGSSVPAEGVQYYIPINGSTYIVTVSTGSAAADLADVMIETFSVG
ncbi:MAG: hypothetical protein ABIP36_01005 [Acidimicrobiales bacterium]